LFHAASEKLLREVIKEVKISLKGIDTCFPCVVAAIFNNSIAKRAMG